MAKLAMFIHILPQTLQRPRFTERTGKAYTPPETREYLTDLALKMVVASSGDGENWNPFDKPISLSLSFFFIHKHRGDLSNYIKAVEDAGNKVLWEDDSLIVEYGRMRLVDHAKIYGIPLDAEEIENEQ